MKSICGIDCSNCEHYQKNNCQGCEKTHSCPFGKECFIAKYILIGGFDSFIEFKKQLIKEINDLKIVDMPEVTDLVALNGEFVNLEYSLPNKQKIKFLNDEEIYLGMQLECVFKEEKLDKCFGIVANMSFILVCEYELNGNNPELIVYKKR